MLTNNRKLTAAIAAKLVSCDPDNSQRLNAMLDQLPQEAQAQLKDEMSQYGQETDLLQLLSDNGENGSHKVQGQEPRFKVLTAEDALEPLPPIDWIIEGLISPGSLNIFFGEAGTKKTFALLDATICIAMGINWLKFKTKKGAVLFIDEESGPRRIKDRFGKVIRGHQAEEKIQIGFITLPQLDLKNEGRY